MADKRYLEALKDMRGWINDIKPMVGRINKGATLFVRAANAMAQLLSPKAQIFVPVLQLAMNMFTGSWTKLFEIMERTVELLEEDINPTPSEPPPAAPGKN